MGIDTFRPNIAVFTNIYEAHLDYHKDMEDYFNAKKILFDKSDLAICNVDDDYGVRLYDELNINNISFYLRWKYMQCF